MYVMGFQKSLDLDGLVSGLSSLRFFWDLFSFANPLTLIQPINKVVHERQNNHALFGLFFLVQY